MANLPTYFAGLLPEGVMFSAAQRLIGAAADDLFAVLAATGGDAIGDVEVRVPGTSARRSVLNLAEATEQIQALLSGRGSAEYLSAIPGVQPKMSLGQLIRTSRNPGYLAKFSNPDFPGVLENEHACMRLARACGLETAVVRLQGGALVVTRFDRQYDKERAQMEKLHVEDMLQVMDRYPNSKYTPDYLDLMRAMEALGASKATLLDALRLYVYSYCIGNGDLHAKNVSLIYDKADRHWVPSPAYDLLSTLPYFVQLGGDQRMALALDDESYGRFSMDEFVAFGGLFGLPEKAVAQMVHKTGSLILRQMDRYLKGVLPDEAIAIISERASSLTLNARP